MTQALIFQIALNEQYVLPQNHHDLHPLDDKNRDAGILTRDVHTPEHAQDPSQILRRVATE